MEIPGIVVFVCSLVILAALNEASGHRHKQLMRLLSDLATMIGDGIDAIIEEE